MPTVKWGKVTKCRVDRFKELKVSKTIISIQNAVLRQYYHKHTLTTMVSHPGRDCGSLSRLPGPCNHLTYRCWTLSTGNNCYVTETPPLPKSLFEVSFFLFFTEDLKYWSECISVPLRGRKSRWSLSPSAPPASAKCFQRFHARSKESNPKAWPLGMHFANLSPRLCLKSWHCLLQHPSFETTVLNWFLVDKLPENDRFREFHWGSLVEVPPWIEV